MKRCLIRSIDPPTLQPINQAVAELYGYDRLGRLLGILFTLASAVSLLQYPLAWWAVRRCGGSYGWAYTWLTLAQVPLFFFLADGCGTQAEEEEEEGAGSGEVDESPASAADAQRIGVGTVDDPGDGGWLTGKLSGIFVPRRLRRRRRHTPGRRTGTAGDVAKTLTTNRLLNDETGTETDL